MKVEVFHRRRSSLLFYTPHVFSQCQTRVKLNQLYRIRVYTTPDDIYQTLLRFSSTVLLMLDSIPRKLCTVGASSSR